MGDSSIKTQMQKTQESVGGHVTRIKIQQEGAGVWHQQETRCHFTVRLSRWASQLTPDGFCSAALDVEVLPLLAELLPAWQLWSSGCLC